MCLVLVCCYELWTNLWHKVSRIWIRRSHAENPQSMRWNVSRPRVSDRSLGCRRGGRGSVHSCSVDPGSSLVSVCQRSTFLPLFFRQSIQCCRVSPCEWHPKETPPDQCQREKVLSVNISGEESACLALVSVCRILLSMTNSLCIVRGIISCGFNLHLFGLLKIFQFVQFLCCLFLHAVLLAAIAFFIVSFPLIVCVVVYSQTYISISISTEKSKVRHK